MQGEDCLNVRCGGSGCAKGEENGRTNMVVRRDAIVRQFRQCQSLDRDYEVLLCIPGVGQSVLAIEFGVAGHTWETGVRAQLV